ncbi:DUF554 family protein, partial [bacterium]
MKGTLLNAGTVAAGSLLGLAIGRVIPPTLEPVAIGALGLVTVGMGLKMFLAARNPVIVAGALVVGGLLGTLLGITPALEWKMLRKNTDSRDRVALVTDVDRGIGQAIALALAQDGVHLALTTEAETVDRDLVEALQKTGAKVSTYPNFTRSDVYCATRAVRRVVADFEALDILVVNSG